MSAPDQLIGIYAATGEYSAGFSAPALQALGARQQVLTGICGVTAGYGTLAVRFDSGTVKQRPVEAVTGNCYELLGLTASMGRLIAAEDVPLAGEPAHVAGLATVLVSAWPAQRAAYTPVASACGPIRECRSRELIGHRLP